MRKHIIGFAILGLIIGGAVLMGSAVNSFFDFVQANSLGSPATGLSRLSVNASTKKMVCTNSDGSSCLAGGGGSSGYTPFANFTALTNSSWSWINQGSASVNFSGGVAAITVAGTGGDSLRIYAQSLPGTPWTVIAASLSGNGLGGTASAGGGYTNGLCLTDGTKVLVYGMSVDTAVAATGLGIFAFTNTTTFNSQVKALDMHSTEAVSWLRISDDGTNWNFYYSTDPANVGWTLFYTEAHNTFLTPTQAGMVLDPFAGSLSGVTITGDALMSWAITSP